MAIVTLWMGVASPFITRRTAASAQTVIDQVNPQRVYEGAVPVTKPSSVAAVPAAPALASGHVVDGHAANIAGKISTERRASR